MLAPLPMLPNFKGTGNTFRISQWLIADFRGACHKGRLTNIHQVIRAVFVIVDNKRGLLLDVANTARCRWNTAESIAITQDSLSFRDYRCLVGGQPHKARSPLIRRSDPWNLDSRGRLMKQQNQRAHPTFTAVIMTVGQTAPRRALRAQLWCLNNRPRFVRCWRQRRALAARQSAPHCGGKPARRARVDPG